MVEPRRRARARQSGSGASLEGDGDLVENLLRLVARDVLLHLRVYGEDSASVKTQYAGIKERICEESGAPRRFINIYLNEEDIRFMDGEKTSVKEGDEISIIPAIAGGQRDRPRAGATSVASGNAKSEASAEQRGCGPSATGGTLRFVASSSLPFRGMVARRSG